MSSSYQKEFMQFLSEVRLIQDAENASYEMSDEILNSVVLTGEIVGRDAHEEIVKIGEKHGLLRDGQ